MKKKLHNDFIFRISQIWCIVIFIYALFNLSHNTTKIQAIIMVIGEGFLFYYGINKLKSIYEKEGIASALWYVIIASFIVYGLVYVNNSGIIENTGYNDGGYDDGYFYK